MQRLMRVVKAVLLPLAVAAVMTAVHAADVRSSVPYVPTPQAVAPMRSSTSITSL